MKFAVLSVVFAVAGAVFLFWWTGFFSKKKSKIGEGASSEGSASGEVPDGAEVVQDLFAESNMYGRLKDYIRSRKASGASAEEALVSVITAYGRDLSVEMALRAALVVGYPSPEIVSCMASRAFQPREIAALISEVHALTINAVADLVMPIVQGDTVAVRADVVFTAMQDTFCDLPEGDSRFLDLPGHLGCSPEDALRIVHANTALTFGVLIGRFELTESPDVVAALVKEFKIDLGAKEQYKALRDSDTVFFRDAVRLLKACGYGANAILITEAEYEAFNGNDAEAVFESLTEEGFSIEEVAQAVLDTNIVKSGQFGMIVRGMLAVNAPEEQVVLFVKSKNVDIEALSAEMTSLGVPMRPRVMILLALLGPHAETAPATVPQAG